MLHIRIAGRKTVSLQNAAPHHTFAVFPVLTSDPLVPSALGVPPFGARLAFLDKFRGLFCSRMPIRENIRGRLLTISNGPKFLAAEFDFDIRGSRRVAARVICEGPYRRCVPAVNSRVSAVLARIGRQRQMWSRGTLLAERAPGTCSCSEKH